MKSLKLLLPALVLLFANMVSAQESEIVKLRGEVRVDYAREYNHHSLEEGDSGFKGSFINLTLDGKIAEKFSYSYRQRLNKTIVDKSFFDATDWLYLKYSHRNWDVSAGKLVVAIGGYEYDRAPIDLYSCSEFWNNIACYQFGVDAAYNFKNGKDRLLAQITQSPFHTDENGEMYGYSLMWSGSHNWFKSLYSVNLFEYQKGSYISYIVLGNQFTFSNFTLELDFMNRADAQHTFLFDNVSVMGEASYKIGNNVKIFAKYTYDKNGSGRGSDMTIIDGTEISMAGAGVEYFPLKESKNLRIHANYFHAFGNNSNPSFTMYDNRRIFNAGLTWKIDLLKIKR
ncbi:MAG: hypothetical protein J6K74_00810 [Marinifilaceae bacterium]|nr:hypothetical protein [Marinifilaceae bacterium]